MGSHSVTCHPMEVNVPHLNPSQGGQYSIYLPQTDERLSWPEWLAIYQDSSPVQRPIHVLTRSSIEQLRWSNTLCHHQTTPTPEKLKTRNNQHFWNVTHPFTRSLNIVRIFCLLTSIYYATTTTTTTFSAVISGWLLTRRSGWPTARRLRLWSAASILLRTNNNKHQSNFATSRIAPCFYLLGGSSNFNCILWLGFNPQISPSPGKSGTPV